MKKIIPEVLGKEWNVYSYRIDMDLFVGSGVGDWRSAPLR